MKVRNSEAGSINALLIPLITAVTLLFIALGFGVWAFVGRQDYKSNSDQKADAAVAVAVERAKTQKDNEFLQKEKEPLKDYVGPASLGGVSMKYPKTWSAYAQEKDKSMIVLMQPNIVVAGTKNVFPLKIEVLDTRYKDALSSADSAVKQGKLTSVAYSFPRVGSVVGLRFDGEIANGKRGAMVFMPLRDKTLKVSTETEDHLGDFDDIILPNFSFQP